VGGQTEAVLFDSSGLVYQIGLDKHPLNSVPIISGLRFENIKAGARLPELLLPLLADIEKLRKEAPELLAAISEIQVSSTRTGAYDLTLWTNKSPAQIRIGSRLAAEKLRYALLLADVLAGKGLVAQEIDYRTATASYTLKGEAAAETIKEVVNG
jgi:hypothetical protein